MPIFKTIRTKFVLAISLLLILIFLGQSLISIRATEAKLIGDVNSEVRSFSHLSAASFVEVYENYYPSGFHKFKEAVEDTLSLSLNTKKVRLVDMEGRIRFDTSNLKIEDLDKLEVVDNFTLARVREPDPFYKYKDDKKGIYEDIIYPFFDEWGRHSYSLIYSISYETIKGENLRAIMRTIFLTILFLVLTVTILSFLTFRITGPLSKLEEGARIVGKGNLDYKLEIKTGDEIELVAYEFNKMTEGLRDSQEKLKEAKEFLEIKVKERTRELEEEKDKTLAIITNFADGLLVLDKEGKLILINPQAEDFFKVRAEEIIGKSLSQFFDFPFLKPLANLFGKEVKKIFRKELLIRKDLTLEVSTIPIERDGEKLGTLVILHDVTREKIIERLKTEFVSLTAHQLRTPLSAIKWTLRIMIDGDLGRLAKKQKEFLEKTYIANERMIDLVNDLLNVTRIEEGRYIYRPALSSFEETCQEVINSFKGEIAKKNLKFSFKRPEEKLPEILIDAEKIKLAIENLIDNAIKYTRPGGEVTVLINRGIKEIEFRVEDTGVGIPEDQQPRVFTKFFRGANVMRMETVGTGLGLFVTKNIIEAHGGRIWFKSKEGKGSTFYFTLPLKNSKTLQKNTKN